MRALPEGPAWELIVVDNGSVDGSGTVLSNASAELPLIVLQENRPGKSRALNRGLEYARGDILLFTDDDVVPDPNWLTALHQASINYPSANIFGGRILVNLEQIPRWIASSYNLKTIMTSEQDLGGEIRWYGDDQYPAGPNLAVRRQSIARGSWVWPVNLGPGTRIPLGDERAFLMQVSHPRSRDRLYVPDSIVHHQITGRRLGFLSAITRCFLGGYAAGLMSRSWPPIDQAEASLLGLALRRIRGSSSGQELMCMLARGIGVLTGTSMPSARFRCG